LPIPPTLLDSQIVVVQVVVVQIVVVQIVVVLKIEPKLRGQTEVLPQANGGVSTDGPVSPDNVIDARTIQGLRPFISTQSHALHELGLEDFSLMDRKHLPRFGRGSCPS
jgi:hypothetical protein